MLRAALAPHDLQVIMHLQHSLCILATRWTRRAVREAQWAVHLAGGANGMPRRARAASASSAASRQRTRRSRTASRSRAASSFTAAATRSS